jgi:TonB family protein
MYAAGWKRAGQTGLIALAGLALAGCGTVGLGGGAAPAVDPALIRRSAPNSGRPEFFVQWRSNGMNGLTQRPVLDPSSQLPDYPRAAVRSRDSGTTTLETCVTADGKLVDVQVKQSSGSDVLDRATLEWAKTAKYQPAKFNDEAFAVCGYLLDWVWQFEEEAEN